MSLAITGSPRCSCPCLLTDNKICKHKKSRSMSTLHRNEILNVCSTIVDTDQCTSLHISRKPPSMPHGKRMVSIENRKPSTFGDLSGTAIWKSSEKWFPKKTNKLALVTKSTGHSQRKLLYLRDDGSTRSEELPSTVKSTTAWPIKKSSQSRQLSGRIPCNGPKLDEKLSRADVLIYSSTKSFNKNSMERKQGYIETIIDKHMHKCSELSSSHSRLKTKSAPPERLDVTADSLIDMFEWSKMSQLRRRTEEKTEAAMEESTKMKNTVRLKQRRAKALLLAITRIFLGIQHWSSEMTTRSAAELQWFTLNTSREAKTLAFNKELFTKARAQAKVPEWAIGIMSKLPPERTEKECRKLHALMRGLRSFEKFTERIQLAMCRSLRYDNVESMRIVLRKGHIGLNFYFIYSGSVFVNVDDVDAKGDEFVKTEVILHRGDSFGEIALLQEVARTATVSVRETCELLSVDREVFSKLCPQIFDRELEEKIDFLQSVPLFQCRTWSMEAKRNLCFQTYIQEYKTNRVVVADSTKEEWMYICMTGKCKIIRHLHFDGIELGVDSGHEEDNDVAVAINNLLTPDGERRGSNSTGRRSSFSERKRRKSIQKDKTRLLQSMSLAYVDSSQRNREKSAGDKTHPAQLGMTLTSLINQTTQSNGKMNSVFLHIGTLERGQVFDLESILNRDTNEAGRKLILVSGGSSLLRIRKSKFFHFADEDGLLHAQFIANRNRYPSERTLLNSYKEKEDWDHYKGKIVKETLRLEKDFDLTKNLQVLAELKQAELEHRTERLLTAYSIKYGDNGPQNPNINRYPTNMEELGAFILGVNRWKKTSSMTIKRDIETCAEGWSNSIEPSQNIPTIIIN